MKTCSCCIEALCRNNPAPGLKLKFSRNRLQDWLAMILCIAAYGFPTPAFSAPDVRQSTLFANNCAQCHARQETGAPFIGVAEDWREAVARGEDAMLINVVQGIRGMPPLGYCSSCVEQDFRVLIRMLAGIPDSKGEQQ